MYSFSCWLDRRAPYIILDLVMRCLLLAAASLLLHNHWIERGEAGELRVTTKGQERVERPSQLCSVAATKIETLVNCHWYCRYAFIL
jgi:hypothetical protein